VYVKIVDGAYLITGGITALGAPQVEVPGVTVTVEGDALRVTCFHETGIASLSSGVSFGDPDELLDLEAWDGVARVKVRAASPLVVAAVDASAPWEDDPQITETGGEYQVRVYGRRVSFNPDDLAGTVEDYEVEVTEL
jgi:hypothetical protein